MTPVEIRNRLGLTQAALAERIGLSLRAWQDIEAKGDVGRNAQALAFLSLIVAVERENPSLALSGAAAVARAFAALPALPSALIRLRRAIRIMEDQLEKRPTVVMTNAENARRLRQELDLEEDDEINFEGVKVVVVDNVQGYAAMDVVR